MISIMSKDRRFKACLEDGEDGVSITLWRAAGPIHTTAGVCHIFRRIGQGLLEVPFHVACDMVHDRVWPMTDDRPHSFPVRGRPVLLKNC